MPYYGLIYQFTDTTNQMIYIGKTKRTKDFLDGKYIGSGKRYRNARNAHGANKFIPSILEWVEGSDNELHQAEIKHIKEAKIRLGSDKLYNLTDGGPGGNTSPNKKWSKKEREEHSKLVKEKLTSLSPERKAKNIETWKRVSNEYWSSQTSDQKKEHMSKAYNALKKSYIATHEDGRVINFTGLNEFCANHKFSRKLVREMAEGRRTKPNKGWLIAYSKN